MTATVLPKGESEFIEISLDRYALEREKEATYFKIEEISATREWIHMLLNDHLRGKRFELRRY